MHFGRRPQGKYELFLQPRLGASYKGAREIRERLNLLTERFCREGDAPVGVFIHKTITADQDRMARVHSNIGNSTSR